MIELSPFFVCYPLSESVLKNKINRARDRHYILHFKIEFIARNLLLCAENQISGSPHRAASPHFPRYLLCLWLTGWVVWGPVFVRLRG